MEYKLYCDVVNKEIPPTYDSFLKELPQSISSSKVKDYSLFSLVPTPFLMSAAPFNDRIRVAFDELQILNSQLRLNEADELDFFEKTVNDTVEVRDIELTPQSDLIRAFTFKPGAIKSRKSKKKRKHRKRSEADLTQDKDKRKHKKKKKRHHSEINNSETGEPPKKKRKRKKDKSGDSTPSLSIEQKV